VQLTITCKQFGLKSLLISIDALDLICSDGLFQTVGAAKQKAGLAAFSLQNGNDKILRVLARVVQLCSCIYVKHLPSTLMQTHAVCAASIALAVYSICNS